MKFIVALVVIAVALGGCGTVGMKVHEDIAQVKADISGDVNSFLLSLSKVAIPDLQAASASAKAHNDPEAAMCWDGLVPIAQSLGAGGSLPTIPKILGGATLFQEVRNLIKGGGAISGGATPQLLKQVNMSCGALYMSARGDIIKVMAMVGLAAAGGPGAASAAGVLPAVLGPALEGLLKAAPQFPLGR